jgi:hypothetical protein
VFEGNNGEIGGGEWEAVVEEGNWDGCGGSNFRGGEAGKLRRKEGGSGEVFEGVLDGKDRVAVKDISLPSKYSRSWLMERIEWR